MKKIQTQATRQASKAQADHARRLEAQRQVEAQRVQRAKAAAAAMTPPRSCHD